MAGNYPDPPGPRMAYDRDGTQVYYNSGAIGGTLTQRTNAELRACNGEIPNGGGIGLGNGGTMSLYIIFPEPRDLTSFYISGDGQGSFQVFQTSTDTTNGIDGTWTSITGPTNPPNTKSNMRTAIQSSSALGIRALRFQWFIHVTGSDRNLTMHFYGKPVTAGDRLEFWHPTLDQSLNLTPAHFDWGDVPRLSTLTRDFRIKNRSSTLTASTITLDKEAITDASPTMVSQTDLRYAGGAYAATATIPSLAPGAISQVATVRLTVLATAQLSLWSQRYTAVAASWS